MRPKIHTLANGATLILTSPGHGAKFSDGTECEAQHKDICDRLTFTREKRVAREIKSMKCVELKMVLKEEQLDFLAELCQQADIVLVSFPFLTALREQGLRERFPNVLAAVSIKETERLPPDQKIWDVNSWSY